MAKRSKVILTGNESKHTSRLAKAIQAIDGLDDFNTKPEGMWGSVATIKSGGVTIKSTELDFEFDVPFDDNLEADEGEIIVYNLSDNTIAQLKTDAILTIEAGYEGDTGLIYSGYITKVTTGREGTDRATTIKVRDSIPANHTINLTFESGTGTQEILNKLLDYVRGSGMVVAKFAPKYNRTIENGVTIDEPLEEAIRTYSEACGVSTFVNNNKVYCCKLHEVDNASAFKVSVDTGLIDSPQPFEEKTTFENYTDTIEGFELEMLLQHKLTVGSKINLASEKYKGTYFVKSGSHRFNESECITKVKAIISVDAVG